MPRSVTGTYTLVAGNPVVTGAVIESEWANNTMADLAAQMTDSLSRTGAGGMEVPLKGVGGTAANPTYTFTNFPNSGIYAASGTDVRLAVGGVDRMRWLAGGSDPQMWSVADSQWYTLMAANKLGGDQETATLAALQTVVPFTATVAGAAMYVNGTSGDRGRLLIGAGNDYTYDSALNEVTLAVAYPVGTKLTAVYSVEVDLTALAEASAASAVASALSAVASSGFADASEASSVTSSGFADASAASAVDADAAAATAAAEAAAILLSATSSTSLTIGAGVQTLTIETGKGFAIGQSVQIVDNLAPLVNTMSGIVTSVNSTTGLLGVTTDTSAGAGTYSDWTVSMYTAPVVDGESFTASGPLDAGGAVTLNVDGTASAVVGTAAFLGAASIYSGGFEDLDFCVAYAPGVVAIARATSTSFYVTIGTVAGDVITWGTEVITAASGGGSGTGPKMIYYADQSAFVLMSATGGTVYAVAFTVSGTVATFGSWLRVDTSANLTSSAASICYDADAPRAMCTWRSTTGVVRVRPLKLSGLVLTRGTEYAITVAIAMDPDHVLAIAYDRGTSKYIVGWSVANATAGYCAVLQSTDTTISPATATQVATGLPYDGSSADYIPAVGKVILTSQGDSTSDKSLHTLLTTSATPGDYSLTVGTLFTSTLAYSDTTESMSNDVRAGPASDRSYFLPGGIDITGTLFGSTKGTVTRFDVDLDGDTIRQTSTIQFSASSVGQTKGLYYDTVTEKMGVLWADEVGDKPTITAFVNPATTVTSANFLGFSDADYVDGVNANILTFAKTSEAQTGLTINAEYYVQGDGTLGTAPDVLGSVFAGRAVAATKIVVKEPSA